MLYYGDFHWFLLLDRRDVLYSGIAFCAERIDVYPVLSPDDKFGEPFAHALVLNICQHALEYAIVHSRSNRLHQFDYLITPFVVANVVGYYVEMFPSHLTTLFILQLLPLCHVWLKLIRPLKGFRYEFSLTNNDILHLHLFALISFVAGKSFHY